jgi:hypothetical protein
VNIVQPVLTLSLLLAFTGAAAAELKPLDESARKKLDAIPNEGDADAAAAPEERA